MTVEGERRMENSNSSKKKNITFITMCIITILFLSLPFVMKFQVVSNIISWFMSALKYQEYKSAYLGIIGGLVGSWFAITGAIYTQRKFDREKEEQAVVEETERKVRDKENIKTICKEMLWSEIRQNDNALRQNDNAFLIAIKAREHNYHFNVKDFRVTLDNWRFIRDRVIEMDIELAIKLMNLYKYYEFIVDFNGNAKEAYDKSQLDFEQYENCYKEVVKYLEFPWKI